MPRKIIASLASLLVLALTFGVWWSVIASASASAGSSQPSPEPTPARERQGDPESPQISFIDSPEPQCILVDKLRDECYVQWRYLSVSATNPAYIISMTVQIDGRFRAYYSGFFQTSMFVPADINPFGFRVSCGTPGQAGKPSLGTLHSFQIKARETSGLSSANHGSVTCPAGANKVFMPNLKR